MRVVCIYDTMVFVLHVMRACPYPQTTFPLASVYQTMSPNEWVKSPKKWVNDHLRGTVLKVKNKWWGPIYDNGKTATCYMDSVALGNEFDINDVNCTEDVNDCWVVCIKYPNLTKPPSTLMTLVLLRMILTLPRMRFIIMRSCNIALSSNMLTRTSPTTMTFTSQRNP